MLKILRKLNALMTPLERRRAKWVFVLMLGMAFVEVLGVASIMPFVAMLASPDILERNALLARAYAWSGVDEPRVFMMALGGIVLALFVSSLFLKGLSIYAALRFANMRAHTFAYRLLRGYLAQPYDFFLNRNTAELSKTLFSEITEVVNGALIPALKVVSGSLVAGMIILLLLAVEPGLTLIVGAVLGGAFFLIYFFSRRLLYRLGKNRVKANARRFILASEALNGIKELRLMGREHHYLRRFEAVSEAFARDQTASKAIGDVPHLAVQAVAFGGVLLLVLYLMGVYGGLKEALPLIALYAFAGYRLLPAFQEIFKNFTQLRFYTRALDNLHQELVSVAGAIDPLPVPGSDERLSGSIVLRDIDFRYRGASQPSVHGLSLEIARGSSAALVGATGAGKSTVMDLILGLLKPDAGVITIDGQPLGAENLRKWQRNIGYVPQSIYLADASVAENIAFGVPRESIDMQAVERAARAAHIHDFICTQLPQGYGTGVGERGMRLSGGQRQRIGIARALYHDPEVVVFDEATSALDGATEASVMEAINALRGQKTILLIAHRLSTVERCDVIFMLQAGRLIAQGSYTELTAGCQAFRRLAQTAP